MILWIFFPSPPPSYSFSCYMPSLLPPCDHPVPSVPFCPSPLPFSKTHSHWLTVCQDERRAPCPFCHSWGLLQCRQVPAGTCWGLPWPGTHIPPCPQGPLAVLAAGSAERYPGYLWRIIYIQDYIYYRIIAPVIPSVSQGTDQSYTPKLLHSAKS